MIVLNEHGLEVEVDSETIEHIKKRGVWPLYKISPRSTAGAASEKKICILLKNNGIGDAIHAMPAIHQKIQDGYQITVVAESFYEEWFTRLGVEFIAAQEHMIGFVEENKHKYGKFYSLRQWCIQHDEQTHGSPYISRFQQFADLIETSLPPTFDWQPILQPQPSATTVTVALGLDSTSMQRGYPHQRELRSLLRRNNISFADIGNGRGKVTGGTLSEIVNHIFNAEKVVAVDSGILAIALALHKPVVALFGPTTPQIIADQFTSYSDIRLTVLQEMQRGCQMPCNFQQEKGFGVNGKCKKRSVAECMQAITPEKIICALLNFEL